MIEFELEKMSRGWRQASIPDDLEILLRVNRTEHPLTASIREMLTLYGHAVNRQTGKMIIGTGQTIAISDDDDGVYLESPPIRTETTFAELQDSLEELLTEIFTRADRRPGSDKREPELSAIQKSLDEDVAFDVFDTYERLTG